MQIKVDDRGWIEPSCFASNLPLWQFYFVVFHTKNFDYYAHYNAAPTNHISRARMEKFAKAVALARLKGTL